MRVSARPRRLSLKASSNAGAHGMSRLRNVPRRGHAGAQNGLAQVLRQFGRTLQPPALLRMRHISERTAGSGGAGRVMRLTTAATTNPVGTPNTPAEMGWMPNHRPSASSQPAQARMAGTCDSM